MINTHIWHINLELQQRQIERVALNKLLNMKIIVSPLKAFSDNNSNVVQIIGLTI